MSGENLNDRSLFDSLLVGWQNKKKKEKIEGEEDEDEKNEEEEEWMKGRRNKMLRRKRS